MTRILATQGGMVVTTYFREFVSGSNHKVLFTVTRPCRVVLEGFSGESPMQKVHLLSSFVGALCRPP